MVVAHGATDQQGISRLQCGGGNVCAGGQKAHSGGVDINIAAALHYLGVAGYDGHTGLCGGGCHGPGNAAEILGGAPGLQNKTGGQVLGGSAPHQQVVDGAAHRQTANVAAGEEQGLHHKAVCGDGQLFAAGHHGAVVHLAQDGIVKSLGKHGADQFSGGRAAAAVGKGDFHNGSFYSMGYIFSKCASTSRMNCSCAGSVICRPEAK